MIIGQSLGQRSSSKSFSAEECSTNCQVNKVLDLEKEFSTTNTLPKP